MVRAGIAVMVIAAISFTAYRLGWLEYERVARWAGSLRELDRLPTAAVFVGIWGIATSFGFPALPLIVAGGAIFGTTLGTVLSLAGTALGALGGYALAGAVAPDLVKRWMGRRLRHDELSGANFLTLVRLRLLPMVPFWAVTYGSGLARVPIPPYLASTLVGQLPSTVLYSYFADKLVESVGSGGQAFGRELVLVSVFLLVLSFAPHLLHRNARRSRQRRRGGNSE